MIKNIINLNQAKEHISTKIIEDEYIDFWVDMCDISHSTKYATFLINKAQSLLHEIDISGKEYINDEIILSLSLTLQYFALFIKMDINSPAFNVALTQWLKNRNVGTQNEILTHVLMNYMKRAGNHKELIGQALQDVFETSTNTNFIYSNYPDIGPNVLNYFPFYYIIHCLNNNIEIELIWSEYIKIAKSVIQKISKRQMDDKNILVLISLSRIIMINVF